MIIIRDFMPYYFNFLGDILKTTINNLEINYEVYGEGKPILLLHGWGSSIIVWKNIVNCLKDQFKLYALDFPGCGDSQLPNEPLTIYDYENLVLKFCKEFDIKNPIVMGHSHGGRVALSLISKGLLSADKTVLFDSAGIVHKKPFKVRAKIRCFKIAKWFLTLPVIKNYTANTLSSLRDYFGSSDYKSAPTVMRKTLVNVVAVDLKKSLKNVNCPTLLVWGDKDTDTPLKNAELMCKLIPDCGLCVLKGCGHFALIEKPYDVNAILNSFLR